MVSHTLTSSGISLAHVEAIHQILAKWANGRTRGLPQMLAPCSLLGNFYLSQVDKRMLLLGYNYIRYVDDIRIFVSSEIELRQVLLVLTEQLKSCYLDVQSSKTQFYTAEKHKEDLGILSKHFEEAGIEESEGIESLYFQDPEFFDDSDLTEISLGKEIHEENLISFLSNILNSQYRYDDRHLRYCINRLGLRGNPAACDLVLSKLYSMPQETATFVGYLSRIRNSAKSKEIVEYVINFLKSEYNIYDWQMMWLLQLLIRYENITKSQLQSLFRIEKLQRHPIDKALLVYLLCSKGGLTFQRIFMDRYAQEPFLEVKMATLCGIFTLEKKERNRFYARAAEERHINQLIQILKNQKVEFCP
jgi:hypothetical protein